jgi:O-antigen/teichoic acid export membrane protein
MQFLLQAGPRFLGFLVTVCLVFLLRSYWALVWATVAAKLAGVALSYAVSPYRPSLSLKGWRYLLSFSVWTWAGGLAMIVWVRAEPFLLGPVLGTALLGLYMIAAEIALLPVSELIEPASTALFPGFALAERGGTEPVAIALTVGGVLALCAAPFAIGVSACSGFLVAALLGPKWNAAQPLIAMLAWLCLFSPFSFVCSSALSAKGLVWRVFVGTAMAAAIKVAALLLVRMTGDLQLIALVSTLVVAAESSIFIWQLRTAGNSELWRLTTAMLRLVVATSGTAGVLYIVPGTWQIVALPRVSAMAAGAAVGLLTFVLFAIFQVALWFLSGHPPGAEAQLLEALRGFGLFRRIKRILVNRLAYTLSR